MMFLVGKCHILAWYVNLSELLRAASCSAAATMSSTMSSALKSFNLQAYVLHNAENTDCSATAFWLKQTALMNENQFILKILFQCS